MIKDNNSFYKANLEIDVEKQFISVDMQISYCISEERTREISFLLHENLNIIHLGGTRVQSYEFNKATKTMLPEAGTLVVYLKEDEVKGEKINIQLSYRGSLGIFKPTGENRVTKEWVALGLYFPWFPLNVKQLSSPNIIYDINVRVENEYSVFGIGKAQKIGDYWNVSDDVPGIDIIVMASKELEQKQIQGENINLEIYYKKNNDVIEQKGVTILNSYINWFGENEKQDLKIVFAPGGSYARKGFVVLRESTNINDKKGLMDYILYLSHELSHLWWTNAPSNTWEEWLNESFSEYSALMIIREMFNQEDFEDLIDQKKVRCLDTHPIKGLDMKYEHRKVVTYDKGCIILNSLETKVGKEKFLNILKQSYNMKIKSSEEFLEILSSEVGREIAKEIDEMLTRY